MVNVGIHGIGTFIPEQIISNYDLEQRLDTSDEWIRTRTGIRERRFADADVRTSDMAAAAALQALQHANLQAEDVDMIIVATSTPDHNFPSVACQVQEILGIPAGIAAYDVSAACSGFIYAMVTAYQFIATGTYQRVLVIGTEKLSNIIDHEDRNTAVLFGDGAGAVILGPVSAGHGVLSFDLGADGTGAKHLLTDPYVIMNGREVFKFAVRQLPLSAENVVQKAGLNKEDVDFLIPHQANIRIIEAARERMGLTPDKVSITLDQYGNTSAASIPLSLAHELEKGRIKDGDVLVMVGFGGGLTWGALCMRWGR